MGGAAGPTPILGGLAIAGVAVATVGAAYLHVRLTGVVSPVRQTVSDYALSPAGAGVFAVMCLALAVGSLGLVSAVIGLEPYGGTARGYVIVLLLTAWCLGLTVAGQFPTDPMGGRMSLDGETHRWAIVLAFVSLPAVGWLLAGAPTWAPHAGVLRFWARTGFVSLGVLVLTYVPVVAPGIAHGPVIIGLSERWVLFVDLVLVVALARPLVRRPAPAPLRPGRNPAGQRGRPGFVTPEA